jgi:Cu(I)/Ag(I) efflux system membrane protein CusA/SilA
MIESIIEFSIRNRFVVIMAACGLVVLGIYSVVNTPVDAIPDLSENQVIVFTDWMGRSPREIEDQITYPLSVNLQGLAGVKAVRASSEFNFSMINIIFEDRIDFYFARQRVSERLTLASTFLPQGVVPYLAPDATALGQIFWYTVEGEGQDQGRLRALQDWYIRYQLNSVPGVAQVASVGGFPIEYQIDVDPTKLRAYGVTLGEIYSAVARSNSSVGGRVIQKGNAEYLVRGVGWITSIRDIENIVVKSEPQKGTPIYVANLAKVGRGSQFRRSVLEKNGNEAVGGVVMMRHGENPLTVTRRIKQKIIELQPGLPEGVRIVPFYDRTRLIEGAIHTLAEILTHEMIIASAAILLILMHFRSALVICATLPLAVLFSFVMMRTFGIASNIMSLSGIAISIGILVDQAIVMVENATHHLTARFGKNRVSGDTRDIVIPACRTVGRPIFFSVLIILLSFVPVFALTGQEGKTFHPLAFTKSFAMLGVAILSITLVPALIPTFIRGRLRSEEESWLVRSLINIYKPVLTWAMPRRNLVMWSFAVLLIVGAGLFPLDAVLGISWRTAFLSVVGLTIFFTTIFIVGVHWQLLSMLSLMALSLAAYSFPRIGTDYMPPLDEGSILDMPVTVPRASVTQAADDLKARNALLRHFPEVESIVGKAGRADTPTDPSPLEMVETVINLRPRQYWPKRKMEYRDAQRQAAVVLQALQDRGVIDKIDNPSDRQALLDPVTMNALARLDATQRELVLQRHIEFQSRLAAQLTRDFTAELADRWRRYGRIVRPVGPAEIDRVARQLQPEFGRPLAIDAAQEDANRLVQKIADKLAAGGYVRLNPELMAIQRGAIEEACYSAAGVLGMETPTLLTRMYEFLEARRDALWRQQVPAIDYEVFDQAPGALNWYCIEELLNAAEAKGYWNDVPKASYAELLALRAELDGPFAKRLFLWKKTKSDLVQEMDSAVQMPGWGNIWTQPIVNRIDMLATGVRTMIGVKVFGSDIKVIQRVSEEVAAALRTVPGAVDVFPDQSIGKGYLEITIDREKAARYGVSVGDVQDVIEVALGGKDITTTVEGRQRFPVRIRYARAWREDEENVKNLLINASGGAMAAGGIGSAGGTPGGMGGGMGAGGTGSAGSTARPAGAKPLQIPLSMVADVRIIEGPGMTKSENGMLVSYVQLNVRDRDIVGFVDEARRVVEQKVKPPQGMYLQWSGQFENQVRARKTMQVVFPAVLLLIFIILCLTYNDFVDAVLMMMAVPEALVGGVFFLWLFGYHFSVAVQVGFIACFGMATETGIIMLVYLREAIDKRGGLEKIGSLDELRAAIIEGAVHRLRPKPLTEGVAIVALAPMLWASGVGHEVISAMAAPVLGGLLIADEVVDMFIPVRFYWVRRGRWLKLHGGEKGLGIGD